jgi:hypothetical protein
MKYRTLAWLPVAVLLPVFVVELVIGPSEIQAYLIRAQVELAKGFWLLGCLAAASVFERGDYLRRGWLLTGLTAGVYFMRDVTFIPPLHDALPAAPLGVYSGLVVLAGNVVQVSGAWVLARAWSVAGIEDTRASGRRTLLFVVAVVVALAITGGSIVVDARRVMTGDVSALVELASDLGDTACFILVGPLLRTALALRGGVLAWTWSLFTTSLVAWMLYDGIQGITTIFGVHTQAAPLYELFHSLGAAYYCVAGLAQRRVVSAPGET